MTANDLVGQVIDKIWLAEDREAIKFDLASGKEVIVQCDAECCSHTWIEDLINPEAAIGSPVTIVGDLELPEHLCQPTKTDNDEDAMQYYGFFIETVKGRFTLVYRNSSNGYYGGSLSWPDEHYYGGVFGQNKSDMHWRPV